MFHRESGVFKTSYRADMALYPLPIAKWTVAAFSLLFVVIAPLTLDDYYLSLINLMMIASVGAIGLNILVGYTGQISIGQSARATIRPRPPARHIRGRRRRQSVAPAQIGGRDCPPRMRTPAVRLVSIR